MQTPSSIHPAIRRAALRIKGQTPAPVDDGLAAARSNLLAFTRHTKPDYQVNWHHRILCHYLDRFVAGEIRRLMVFMPPQNGKSELISRRLPAYILGRSPSTKIIATSYGASLASDMNRDVQRVIDSEEYQQLFPATRLYAANVRTVAKGTYLRNSDVFEIVGHRGVYRNAGVGGSITGKGFDIGIIDDPVKGHEEARSAVMREKVWRWYKSDFYSRQGKNAGILLVMTRWHMDDLAGRLLNEAQDPRMDQWTVISFPAIAEQERHPDDPRQPGEALWPDKYPLAFLHSIQLGSSYEWNALYQQRPVAEGGGMFKRDKVPPEAWLDSEPADIVRRARFWDLALSEKTSADFTVGVLLGETKDRRFVVLDVQRFQTEWDHVTGKIAQVAIADGPKVQIGIEAAFYQTRAVGKLLEMPALHHHSIRGIKPDADKVTRSLPFQARWGEGMVYLLRRAWTNAFLDELCSFPLGAHDDMVDAVSGAYLMLDKKPLTVTTTRWA